MSAVGSRAVMGASRWLEAMVLVGPMNRTATAPIARRATGIAIRVILFFIMHLFLFLKVWNSRSVERDCGGTHPASFRPRTEFPARLLRGLQDRKSTRLNSS